MGIHDALQTATDRITRGQVRFKRGQQPWPKTMTNTIQYAAVSQVVHFHNVNCILDFKITFLCFPRSYLWIYISSFLNFLDLFYFLFDSTSPKPFRPFILSDLNIFFKYDPTIGYSFMTCTTFFCFSGKFELSLKNLIAYVLIMR